LNVRRSLWAGWVLAWALTARLAGAGITVEVGPEKPSPGEVFSVRVTGAETHGKLEVSFGDRTFALWRGLDGLWHGLVAVDRDEKPEARELLVLDRSLESRTLAAVAEVVLAPRDYPVQRLTVSERMVTLSPEDQERAVRESRLIREALALRSDERLWRAPFLRPVEGPVSSPFGLRRIYNGKRRGYHSGLDIAAPRGAPVGVAAAGAVALVGDFFYTGKTVLVDHGFGLLTAYFHLDTISVDPGQQLGAGDVVGQVGSTGRSTGPHLHWGVYLAGVKVDPLSLVRATGGAAGGSENP
jgi:murein DD-endopeptidase MepM/ murein hydrolase activator NlpD